MVDAIGDDSIGDEAAVIEQSTQTNGVFMGTYFAALRLLLVVGVVTAAATPTRVAAAPATQAIETKRVLVTKTYQVTITRRSVEGSVEDNDVTYHGVSKKSGKSLTLKGSTWHTRGPDGSPSRFLGYIFRSGSISYRVSEEGRLEIVRGDNEVLVNETGYWKAPDPG